MEFKERVEQAWRGLSPPFKISGSDEGDEPFLLEKEFEEKPDWKKLDHAFLDQTPDGFGSALSFFADEAFRYYLAAFMVVDSQKEFDMTDVVFHLTHGLTCESKNEKVNPLRFGEQTWINIAQSKFSMFTKEQVSCIIEYLQAKRIDEFERDKIDEALRNYWTPRLNELTKA